MNPVQRQLVLCCREQWLGGQFYGVEPWGDGLRLDSARITSGFCCLPVIDSAENGFCWDRVVIDADLPPDSALRVYAHTDDDRSWGGPLEPESGEVEEARALRLRFGPPVAQSGDFLLRTGGRYLWLALELAAAGTGSPTVRKVTVRMAGDHMVDYLPAIYQEDDFTRRFLSIFNSMFLDMEDSIYALPGWMDYESTDPEMLRYLASWMCIGDETNIDALISRISGALPEYETQYTVGGIRRSVRRLTGRDPWIVEQFNVSPNRAECRNPKLYRKLYGDDPYRFFVLLREGTFPSRQALEDFRRRMEELIPAGTSMELVLLKQCIQLDWHTYLGINSTVGGYVPAAIDETMTIHYDTTIGGANHE
ncbi:hypothetical protein OBV_26200 [Oscillibacter valericigenes Sjm18-20]|nr:hypothetical protein OBV_26200 [Oscillibacter valericigenes Sjm18-20]